MPISKTAFLFDIDGTLVDTGGAGGFALRSAVAHVTSSDPEQVSLPDLAGATDNSVLPSMLSASGIEPTESQIAATYEVYFEALEKNLQDETRFSPKLLPHVTPLLESLASNEGAFLTLLTGNAERGARIKLEHFGISHWFSFEHGAYGNEYAERGKLASLATKRLQAEFPSLTHENIWVVGDTPKDIDCAKSAGIRCAAVATGNYSEEFLQNHGADLTGENLGAQKLAPLFSTSACEMMKSA